MKSCSEKHLAVLCEPKVINNTVGKLWHFSCHVCFFIGRVFVGDSQPMDTRTVRLQAEDMEAQHVIFGTNEWKAMQRDIGLSAEAVDTKLSNLLIWHKKWIDEEEAEGQKLLEEYKEFYANNDKALHATLLCYRKK